MQDRKNEIETELELYRDLSRSITDQFALSLLKEVMNDLQAELGQQQNEFSQEQDSSTS